MFVVTHQSRFISQQLSELRKQVRRTLIQIKTSLEFSPMSLYFPRIVYACVQLARMEQKLPLHSPEATDAKTSESRNQPQWPLAHLLAGA